MKFEITADTADSTLATCTRTELREGLQHHGYSRLGHLTKQGLVDEAIRMRDQLRKKRDEALAEAAAQQASELADDVADGKHAAALKPAVEALERAMGMYAERLEEFAQLVRQDTCSALQGYGEAAMSDSMMLRMLGSLRAYLRGRLDAKDVPVAQIRAYLEARREDRLHELVAGTTYATRSTNPLSQLAGQVEHRCCQRVYAVLGELLEQWGSGRVHISRHL